MDKEYPFQKGARVSLNIVRVLLILLIMTAPFGLWLFWRVSKARLRITDKGVTAGSITNISFDFADVALVKAHRADAAGNLRYRLTARNFNPLVATAGKLTLVEAEEIVDFITPDDIHTPGIYVQRIVPVEDTTKDIEQRTVRTRVDA